MARIQSEFRNQNVEVIAVNIYPDVDIQTWIAYWRASGGGNVIYAKDSRQEAIRALNIRTSGATVIIDKKGRIVFQDQYATRYGVLKFAIESAI